MAFWDWLTGTKRPPAGTAVVTPGVLKEALLKLNRPTAPWSVRTATPEEGCDLVAEWRIVDAQWYEIFAKAGLTKTFRVMLKLDPAKAELRAMDEETEVEWSAGVPSINFSRKMSRGQVSSVQFGTAIAFTEQGDYGRVYQYRFASQEIKGPIQDATVKAGWTYRGVAFGRL